MEEGIKIEKIEPNKSDKVKSLNVKSTKKDYVVKEKHPFLIPQAIVFSSLLISGILLFSLINFLELNWYFPTFVFIIACVFGYNKFFTIKK